MQESFNCLLEQYEFLSKQIDNQTRLLRELSETTFYQKRVKILKSIPGIGMISAMEILLELQDLSRFRQADQLAAYVGLTPSQYSSADKIRMDRITGMGKKNVRTILVEAAWRMNNKDKVMQAKYERIKAKSGAKRAIVAVARKLIVRMRRLLLDGNFYILNFGT